MEHQEPRAWREGPGGDPPPDALPVLVARLEERLIAGDRLYQHKFGVLERQVGDLDRRIQAQQKWVQGTAVLVGLEVLGLILSLLSGWRP